MTTDPDTAHGRWGLLTGLVVGLVALGPSLVRGYILRYDMVFVPEQPVTATTLGLSGVVPRAVPNDLVVALASHVVPGDVVQKLVLLSAFVLGGWGIGRLLPTRSAAVTGAVAFTWNPWMAERLLIGHWGFLLGYAALPWVAAAAVAVRRREPGALVRLSAVTVLTGLSGSTSWGLALLMTVPVLLWRGADPRVPFRAVLAWVAVSVGSAAVWAVPSLARAGGIADDPAGFPAFAARGDSFLGVWGQLVTLGGIWNRGAVPPERTNDVVVLISTLLVVLAVVGGGRALWRSLHGYGAAVVVAGGASLVLAAVGSTAAGLSLLLWLDSRVAAVGLLRDGQKWLAPFALVVCLCAGHAVERARRWLPAVGAGIVAAAVAAPVLLLPSLAWGAQGRLVTADYPEGWAEIRSSVRDLPEGTDVASLPETYYRRFAWNSGGVVLDPVPRYVPRVVVSVDDLPLRDGVVRGEDPRGRRISDALAQGAPLAPALAAMGVSGVVVAEDQPGGSVRAVEGLPLLATGGGLRLYGVPGEVAAPPRPAAWTATGLVIWTVTVALVLVSWGVGAVRRLLASRPTDTGP